MDYIKSPILMLSWAHFGKEISFRFIFIQDSPGLKVNLFHRHHRANFLAISTLCVALSMCLPVIAADDLTPEPESATGTAAPETVQPNVYDSDIEDMMPAKNAVVEDATKPAADNTAEEPQVYDSDIEGMMPALVSPELPKEPADKEREFKAIIEGDSSEKTQSEDTEAAPATEEEKRQLGILGLGWFEKQENWGWDWSTLRFTGRYGLTRFKFGGRLAVDAGILNQDDSLDEAYPGLENNTDLRSAQLILSGNFGPSIFYKLQYEAGSLNDGLKDAYVVLQNVPYLNNLRIGQGKEPFSLEYLTSFKFLTFMERSLPTALGAGRNWGIMTYNTALNQKMTWAVGLFAQSSKWGDVTIDTGEGVDISTRITGIPYENMESNTHIHIGINLLLRKNTDGMQITTLPETQLTSITYIDTGVLDSDAAINSGIELAIRRGPYSLQAEANQSRISLNDGTENTYRGYYLLGSYFITGEFRRYNRGAATFAQVIPLKPLGQGGWGAWEFAARLSSMDLNSGEYRGGKETNITLGLNWYLNKDVRVMLNYINSNIDSQASGRMHNIQTRIQYTF
ncbi:MAG: porin [Pseudomonadales bacterium]